MKVYPQPLEIGDEDGFTVERDLFGKADLAAGMSNLVSVVKDPLVIAFDGVWGSGKSTFLRMWAGELRKAGHPVIYFDAFENDYVDDAFAALARELVGLAEAKTSRTSKASRKIKEQAVELGAQIVRGAVKVGTKAAVRIVTAGALDADSLKGLADDITAEAGNTAEDRIKYFLDNPKKQKETVENFRKTLAQLPALLAPLAEDQQPKALIFIVDELDRCKPNFALAILERIKHFMSVPNVHFILGTDTRQLEGSVRYAYGTEIDARSYLQKFINLTILNTEKTDEKESDLEKYAVFLAGKLGLEEGRESPVGASMETIVRLTREHQLGFRTIERAFSVLSVALAFTPKNHLKLGAIMGGLIMMKLLAPHLFVNAKRGVISLDEAKNFLHFTPNKYQENNMSWEESWWTYLLADPRPKHLEDFGRDLRFNYSFRDPKDVVRHTANKVIDRLALP